MRGNKKCKLKRKKTFPYKPQKGEKYRCDCIWCVGTFDKAYKRKLGISKK